MVGEAEVEEIGAHYEEDDHVQCADHTHPLAEGQVVPPVVEGHARHPSARRTVAVTVSTILHTSEWRPQYATATSTCRSIISHRSTPVVSSIGT
jgi:hypothetical protein